MAMYEGKARNNSEPSMPITLLNLFLELLCAVAIGSIIVYMLVEWACSNTYY